MMNGAMGGRSGGGGGIARAQTINRNVALVTGLITTVSKFGLLAPTFTKDSGNANLAINSSTGEVSATVALTEGATQSMVGKITGSDGVVLPFTLNCTGFVALTAPAAPSLTATAGNGQVTLSWTDGSTGGAAITAHKLYRGTVSGSLTLIGTIMTGSPYVDTGLTNGDPYYYKLSAVNSVGESALSTEQSATPSELAVILVALLGQSNMIGRTLPDGSETSPTGIYQWVNDPADGAYGTLVESITPLKFPEGKQDYDPTAGENLQYAYGPGSNLLKKIKTQSPTAIVIAVPCAYGASSLMSGTPAPWAGHATPGSGGTLFEAAVTATNAARAAAAAAYPGATITVHTAWVQGDQESTTRSAYAAALTNVINCWRSRVTGATHGKFIIGSVLPQRWIVGSPSYDAGVALVNAAHVDVSLAVSNVIYVAGPDERASNDNLHYGPLAVNVTFGNRLGDSLTDASGPSVTTGITQGGNVGTTTNIPLTHDDASGHATFHFAGGANDALFEITDPYINGTTQPQARLIDNATVAGTYVLKAKARDGSGNYGADRTITFTQSVPAAAPVTVTDHGRFDWPTGFATSSRTVDIKAGLNTFTFVSPAGANQGSAFSGTVNGNAMTNLGYAADSGTCVTLAYRSAVDVTGATVVISWGGTTETWTGRHVVVTGTPDTPSQVTSRGWTTVSAPQALASQTVPTDGIQFGLMFSANAITGVASGTTQITRDSSFYEYLCATRTTTGSIEATGGGGYSAQIGFAFAKTA